jgi:hypothetical protein
MVVIRLLFWIGLGAWLIGLCACRTSRLDPGNTPFSRAALDARLNRVFTNGILYKPKAASAESLASHLAPLFVWELNDVSLRAQAAHPFAAAEREEGETGRAVVYARESTVELQGQPHAQVSYLWSCPDPGRPQLRAVQGIRLTLNSVGQPVIWEVLSEADELGVIFVAESLEGAAKAAYGGPLPGRRYAIESAAVPGKNCWVARLLQDGPMPMGPIVYLQAQPPSLVTVLCRCMPAQVNAVPDTRWYDLVALTRASEQSQASSGPRPTVSQDGSTAPLDRLTGLAVMASDAQELESCLRLPRGSW